MPADVGVFLAYLGQFDCPYIPKSLKGEPIWGQKKGEKWAKNVDSCLCLGANWCAKRHESSPFYGHFGLFGHPICPKNGWKSQKWMKICHRNKGAASGETPDNQI